VRGHQARGRLHHRCREVPGRRAGMSAAYDFTDLDADELRHRYHLNRDQRASSAWAVGDEFANGRTVDVSDHLGGRLVALAAEADAISDEYERRRSAVIA